MPYSRIVSALLAAIAVIGVARAEEYAILPGAESLLGDMLGAGQTLPGGCTLGDGQIDRTAVVAGYTCGGEQVVLQLLHPGVAPRGAVRTQRFAVTVKSGAPPAGLVDAVAERIRAREAAFEWASVGSGPASAMPWPELIAVGALIVVLVFWFVRRRRPE